MTSRRTFLRSLSLAGGAAVLGGWTSRVPGARSFHIGNVAPTRAKSILVLGGTGFIGPHLVRRAVERGHTVSIFTRGRRDADLPASVERLVGDRDGKLEALHGRRWDAVIDDSATNPDWVRQSTALLRQPGNVMNILRILCCTLALSVIPSLPVASQSAPASPSSTYQQLAAFFREWRTFEEPPRVQGAPDYSDATSARRLSELATWQQRLRAIDTTGWSIAEQVDWHLVRAEMNGMQYHLSVLQPFARDPAYYASVRTSESDTPAEEGPTIHGAVRLWQYGIWPRTVLDTVRALSSDETQRLTAALRTVPPLLQQARTNLAGSNARDLWVGGVRAFEQQSEALSTLRTRVAANDRDLLSAIDAARDATDAFAAWLQGEAPSKTGPSGIGREQYTWYLRNVLLVPLSWEDEVTISQRELARAHASLRLEEARNRSLPPMVVANTPADYAPMQERAIARWMGFVRDKEIVTMEPWMERALRERMPSFAPEATRNFFAQATQRDPVPLWTHLYHWWDNARIRNAPHASLIRRTPLLYNVWMSRAEGMATAMEEWMMHAGLYDDSPRSREIVWVMLITRAARGLGNLYAHANLLDMEGAGNIHVEWTPRGWMRRDPLLGFEQHLYLRQPGYGASYVTGGRLMEETMALRARQLGDAFTLRRFFDEVNAVGMIPVSLLHWELTGDARMVSALSEGFGEVPPGQLPSPPGR